MIAGIILQEETGKDCQIAILGDELVCKAVKTNPEIVEILEENKPEIVAVNVGTESSINELNDQEEELKEEGYSFTPTSHDAQKSRRLEALKNRMQRDMGAEMPEIIRFDPQITAEELALHGDQALESFGIDTSEIRSAEQFDAVLGAVTARFYQQDQFRDLGVIVPESVDSGQQ